MAKWTSLVLLILVAAVVVVYSAWQTPPPSTRSKAARAAFHAAENAVQDLLAEDPDVVPAFGGGESEGTRYMQIEFAPGKGPIADSTIEEVQTRLTRASETQGMPGSVSVDHAGHVAGPLTIQQSAWRYGDREEMVVVTVVGNTGDDGRLVHLYVSVTALSDE